MYSCSRPQLPTWMPRMRSRGHSLTVTPVRAPRGIVAAVFGASRALSERASTLSREEAELVAVLLGQFDEVGAQRARRLAHELVEVDRAVLVGVGARHDAVDLLLAEEAEAEGVQRVAHLRLVEHAVAILVGRREEPPQRQLAEGRLIRVNKSADDLRVQRDDLRAQRVELLRAHHALRAEDERHEEAGRLRLAQLR